MHKKKEKKLSVLYILDKFPVHSQTFILNEILAVRRKDINLSIVALRRGNWKKTHSSARDIRENIHYLCDVKLLRKLYIISPFIFFNLKSAISVWKRAYAAEQWKKGALKCLIDCCYLTVLFSGKIDHIHVHFAKTAADYAYYTHLLSGIPYTFTSHGYDIYQEPPRNMREKTENAYRHLTVSNFNREYLIRQMDLPPERVEVCYLGVDLKKFSFSDHGHKDKIILNIGRLESVKGHEYLIEACRKLRQEGVDFKCLIVGDGSRRDELTRLIEERRLDGYVRLVGSKTNEEIVEYYRKSMVFALPSLSEGLPIVLMEALACGVPCVASNVNGIPEIIQHEKSGLLVEPGDANGLADKTKFLLDDSEMKRKCIQEGLNLVKNRFNIEISANKLISFWN